MANNNRKRLIPVSDDARNQSGLIPASHAAYDASVSMQEPIRTNDAFSNPVARLGAGTQNLMQATQYPLTRLSNQYNLLTSLFRSNWVVGNIVSTIPEDVTKKWYKIQSKDLSQDQMNKFDRAQRQIQLRTRIVDGMKWGRLYGGAVGIILIKGQNDLEAPLDYDMIMPDSFRGLFIADRWSGVYPTIEIIGDINDPDFGLPEYYEVRNEYGIATYRVHHSRVIRFIGQDLPYYEAVSESFWGKSVIESIYEEIVKKDNVSHNIASLTFKANLDVIEMDNIDQLFAIGGDMAQRRFWNLVQAQSVVQSNFGTRIVNKGDSFNQYQYAFTGLRDVYEIMLLDVAGAARIPATKLFGRQPSGLNATGEYDMINYNDYLEEVRETSFKPIINKLLPVMALSAWGTIPDDLEAVYDSIQSPNEVEKATIAQRKVGALMDVYNNNGIPGDILLKELKNLEDVTGMFGNITDDVIRENEGKYKADIELEYDPMAGLSAPGEYDTAYQLPSSGKEEGDK